MFESAELGHEIDKDRYESEVPKLRSELLATQYEVVKKQAFSVVILITGADGGGMGDTLNTLNEWMDPRHLQTNAIRPVNEGLEGRPPIGSSGARCPRRAGSRCSSAPGTARRSCAACTARPPRPSSTRRSTTSCASSGRCSTKGRWC